MRTKVTYSQMTVGSDGKLEPGDKAVAILKNCVMIVEADENKKLKIAFTGDEPIVIDDDLDMYVED